MIRAFSFLPRMFDTRAEAAGDSFSFIFDPRDISYYLFARGGTGRDAKRVTETAEVLAAANIGAV